jgi:hypothetical protein
LILPQSWTLNNDYGWLIEIPKHTESFWRHAWALTRSELATGRFHPVYNLWIMLQYHTVPLEPVIFRGVQFALLGMACLFLALTLRELGLSRAQIIFGEALFVSNLTIKDWITLTASFEPLATCFFLASLFYFLRGKRWISAALFACSFLSKESYFVLLPCFLFLEWSKTRRVSAQTLFAFALPCAAFAWFVHDLPRVYTARVGQSFSLLTVLRALILPPARCFGPVLLLVGYEGWKNRARLSQNKDAIGVGAIIIATMTLILALWGPFDSWWYLHILIPIGWVFVMAPLWQPDTSKIALALTALSIIFLGASVMHGSRNLWHQITEAKTAAQIACEDRKTQPDLTIYTNCEEGSSELTDYLQISQVCPNPPTILWTGNQPYGLAQPFEVIYSPKCAAISTELLRGAPVRAALRTWTVFHSP